MQAGFKIYGDLRSGNCLKVKYVADFLNLACQWIAVDLSKGETRTPDFLNLNPAGQIPVAQFSDGRALAQSNAIIAYLGRESALLPRDAYGRAKVDEWLFWEQYSHEPYIAVARFQMAYLGKRAEERDPKIVERGEAALDLMEDALEGRNFLVNDAFSIADIALLAYTRLAHEGGFDLSPRPAVRAWIARCAALLKI